VRSSESACPFCAAALAPVPDAGDSIARSTGTRLNRAALFALGASAAAVAACSSAVAIYGGPAVDGPPDADMQVYPPYGHPPFDAGTDAHPLLDAAYGGPPFDAADAADAAEPADAADDADDAESGIAPAYGAPP
jgi:hypothetical protein